MYFVICLTFFHIMKSDGCWSSDPCQHTVCSRSSQLSMNSAYDYKGKGHFSCSERHPNELVTVYLTLPSTPLKQTFYFHCQQAS